MIFVLNRFEVPPRTVGIIVADDIHEAIKKTGFKAYEVNQNCALLRKARDPIGWIIEPANEIKSPDDFLRRPRRKR
jgi:hypothetical protein